MLDHWLNCPPNGYLGSGYGSDLKALLQTAANSGLANDVIEKARDDIPILRLAPPGSLKVFTYDADIDRKVVAFEFAGRVVTVADTK